MDWLLKNIKMFLVLLLLSLVANVVTIGWLVKTERKVTSLESAYAKSAASERSARKKFYQAPTIKFGGEKRF